MLKTRPIIGTVLLPDGKPGAGAKVYAQLSQFEIDNGLVVPRTVKGIADENGAYSIDLWPNERGSGASYYYVMIKAPGAELFEHDIVVPDGDGPVPLTSILDIKPYPPLDAAEQAVRQAQDAAGQAVVDADRAEAAAEQTEDDRRQTGEDRLAVETFAAKFGDIDEAIEEAGRQAGLAKDEADKAERIANEFGDVESAILATEGLRDETAILKAATDLNATSANTDANRAESAADAALIQAGVYVDEPTGRAAVADGQAFKVQGGGDVAAYEYRRVNASTSVLIATYPSSAIAKKIDLSKIAEADRSDGFEWSPAGWYLSDVSRTNFSAWYGCEREFLFQDAEGTVPVISPGDPVRLIKNKGGNDAFDLLVLNNESPGIYKTLGGIGYVEHTPGIAFRSRSEVSIKVPFFIAHAQNRPGLFAGGLFGAVRASASYVMTYHNGTGQNRAYSRARGGSEVDLVQLESAFRSSPINSAHVVDALFQAGMQDVGINGSSRSFAANEWTSGLEITGARLGTSLSSATNSYAVTHDFFGGFAVWGDPGEETRKKICTYFARKIEKPAAPDDFNILIVSDSTGDDTNETAAVLAQGGDWPWRFAQYLAEENPNTYVGLRGYEDTTFRAEGYRPEIAVQDGDDGAIRIYNGAIAGSQPQQALGLNFQKMLLDVPAPRVIFINHGYNPNAASAPSRTYPGQILNLVETLKEVHPGVPIFLLRQPRTASSTSMDAWVEAMDEIAALYGDIVLVDVWQKFRDLNENPDLYADGLHPSKLGTDQYIAAVIEAWEAHWPAPQGSPGFVGIKVENPVKNPHFYKWRSAMPDDWVKTGSGTIYKESVFTDEDSPYSLAISDTSSTSTYIEQVVSAEGFTGADAMLVIRMAMKEQGLDVNFRSRIEISSDGIGGVSNYFYYSQKAAGGYQWAFCPINIPADATSITIRLYGRYDGANGCTTLYSRVGIVAGDAPLGIS